jgi:Ca-activated chloride channel homolog
MFRFGDIHILVLLTAIPLLFLGFLFYRRNYKRRLKKFADNYLLYELMPLQSNTKPFIKISLSLFILSLCIFALARLQFGTKLREVKKKGIEMIIALDISNSMLATDIQPSRLDRAKQAIESLIGRMKNDKIGLIIFAGEAYTQLPITSDYVSAKMFLSDVNPDYISRQGTAIGDAIDLATHSFTENDNTSKAIVVISDGENFEGDAVGSASLAKERGIKVYTIGMGSTIGSLIPKKDGSGFFTDKDGNPVTTRMNPEMLSNIAVAGGGEYFTASTSNVGLDNLYNELSKLDKKEMGLQQYSEFDDQYSYFLWAALLTLLIDLFIFERKNIWFNKLKLFE